MLHNLSLLLKKNYKIQHVMVTCLFFSPAVINGGADGLSGTLIS